MSKQENLRICNECLVPHYENCYTCFGWGFRMNGTLLIAREACREDEHEILHPSYKHWDGKSKRCGECGSDRRGVATPEEK